MRKRLQLLIRNRFVTRLHHNEEGGILIMFAVLLPVLLLAIGGFVDYGLAVIARSAVLGASDSAALAVAIAPEDQDETAIAKRYYETNYQLTPTPIDIEYMDLQVDLDDDDIVTITSNSSMNTYFMKVGSVKQLPVATKTAVSRQKSAEPDMDLVVVADISGSMAAKDLPPSRLKALQSAYNVLSNATLDNNYEVRLGLTTYNSASVHTFPLTSRLGNGAEEYGALDYAPPAFNQASGGTCGACGLLKANDILSGVIAPATARKDNKAFSNRKMVVLLTDGAFKNSKDDGKTSFPNALDEAKAVCDDMHAKGYAVYSIFIGDIKGENGDGIIDPAVNADYETHVKPTLEHCATHNMEGKLQYYVAPDQETLEQIFLTIAKNVQTIRILE